MSDIALKQSLAPPKGFRKAIPIGVKLTVVLQQAAICPTCKLPLQVEGVEYDHTPALQLRRWDEDTKDTVPPANDPNHIIAKHEDCHAVKTHGRKGESKLSRVGGDTSEIAKLRRLEKKGEEARRRLLAKGEPKQDIEPARPKPKWPSRPFQTRSKRKDKA